MSTWSYKLIQHPRDDWGEMWLELCEVYVNDDGSLMGYCKATVGGYTIEEAKNNLTMMHEAFLSEPLSVTAFQVGNLGDKDV